MHLGAVRALEQKGISAAQVTDEFHAKVVERRGEIAPAVRGKGAKEIFIQFSNAVKTVDV